MEITTEVEFQNNDGWFVYIRFNIDGSSFIVVEDELYNPIGYALIYNYITSNITLKQFSTQLAVLDVSVEKLFERDKPYVRSRLADAVEAGGEEDSELFRHSDPGRQEVSGADVSGDPVV